MEKNSEKKVVVDGLTLKLLRKDEKWVFPFVTYYQHELGSPICLELLEYKEDSNSFDGCQFIDTNNNGEAVLDWLVLYELGVPTGRYAASGHCMYPEVDFYRSERFMRQKEFCDRHFNFVG